MKQHVIIGMAGHIDHGKTALIKALTGIETDQLKEERQRGITIDIGFAYWKENVTIIDVPGHEKFIRNMVAGVSTVDLFLLVIAADDGIMPQTIEHLDILKFFNVKDGIVVLNKVDLVDEEWQELVSDEITQFMQKNGFDKIPVIPVSAVENIGITRLDSVLAEKINQLPENNIDDTRPFRLNVDRSFSAKGFGSVVTGTVLSSVLKPGQTLVTLPAGRETKVRGIQVHQKSTEIASIGQRAAINLANITTDELPRGTVIVEPETLSTTQEILAQTYTTGSINFRIKRHSAVRVHLGTAELQGKITWFEEDSQLEKNKKYHVRIKLSERGVAAPGDAILIRSESPVITIAGGKVVQIDPPSLKRNSDDWQNYFKILTEDNPEEILKQRFSNSGFKSVTAAQLQRELFRKKDELEKILAKLESQKILVSFEYGNEKHYAAKKQFDKAVELLVNIIHKNLTENGYKTGLNFQEILNLLKPYSFVAPFLNKTLKRAVNAKQLFLSGEYYSDKEMSGSGSLHQLHEQIQAYYKDCRFNAPDFKTLAGKFSTDAKNVKTITLDLARQGVLQSIGGSFYLHKEVLQECIIFLKEYFTDNKALGIAEVKEFIEASRKYVIPLMEYLDSSGYTQRKDDLRVKGPNL